MKQWKATAEYLSQKIDGMTFEIVPINFEEVMPAGGGIKENIRDEAPVFSFNALQCL